MATYKKIDDNTLEETHTTTHTRADLEQQKQFWQEAMAKDKQKATDLYQPKIDKIDVRIAELDRI